MNEIKEAMRNAAGLIGAVNGHQIVVSRKALPIRKHAIQARSLIYSTRLMYDGAGRCIEEVQLVAGKLPDGAARFYLIAQIEVTAGERKASHPLNNPIPAKNLREAFERWDSVFRACCEELERKANGIDNPS